MGRVATNDELNEKGDYCVHYAEGDSGPIARLTMILPFTDEDIPLEACWGVIDGAGSDVPGRPRWDITEDSEGKVTASPSILTKFPYKGVDREWHGYLRNGVFESV